MAYTPQEWNDADPATPLTAARLDHLETGIEDADTRLTALEAVSTVYPLSGYGFHSATCSPETATVGSGFGPWHVRIWVPAGCPITTVGMVVDAVGTLGAGGLNGFAIYTDAGTGLLGETVNADSLWTVAGLRTVAMVADIPAQAVGRFVRVLANVVGYSSSPNVAYAVPKGTDGPTLNGVGSGTRRTAYMSSVSSWPATIDPDTLGTVTNALPFIVLG